MNQGSVARDPVLVREMFDRLSRRYDLANHVLSAGSDFLWRRRSASILVQHAPACVLDLATGTGDLALALSRAMPRAEIVGADFSEEMLAIARRKGLSRTVVADALHLPFAAQSFEAVTIGFGLRNMSDWSAALREMRRVLTSRGHLLVLDFSLPEGRFLRSAYRFYLHRLLPPLSGFISGQAAAYQYLGASIEDFPAGEAMCRLINENGFTNATAEPLTGGISTIYLAQVQPARENRVAPVRATAEVLSREKG